MVQPGRVGIVAGMSFAAGPLAENLVQPDLRLAYGSARSVVYMSVRVATTLRR